MLYKRLRFYLSQRLRRLYSQHYGVCPRDYLTVTLTAAPSPFQPPAKFGSVHDHHVTLVDDHAKFGS